MNQANREALAATEKAAADITAFISAVEPRFLRGGRLIYLGAGTSGRLGVLDASEAPPTFCVPPDRIIGLIAGGDGSLRRSSEGKEDDPHGAVLELETVRPGGDDTVLGIAAGGTTPYVLGALEWAKNNSGKRGTPLTALLTCTPIERPSFVDHGIVIDTGPEILTGSTRLKAGTATKLVLNAISTALMVRLGKVYGNLMVDVRATNAKLRDRAARIISTLTGLDRTEAFALLDRADGVVKTAVVMQRLGVDRVAAEARLAVAHGRLERILEEA
jgi:N-acetylmuramic acid 6-phosphate etherase